MIGFTGLQPKSDCLPPVSWLKALGISLPMLLLSFLLLFHSLPWSNPEKLLPAVVTYLFVNALFFLIVYTGNLNRYRSPLFITVSLLFVVSFTANLIETRGTMTLSTANIMDGQTPLCPLAIPMLLIPAALTKTIIFPGSFFNSYAAIAPVLILWLGFSLAVGRGWCSWICFYGGMVEGFSRLCCKVRLPIDRKWTYAPWAVLVAVVLTSALTLAPTYCEWLCPFKAVTEFPALTSTIRIIQAVVFVALFLGLVIVLPILSGKRIQCALFCPFGAFLSLFNKINIFAVRIDRERCVHCKLCLRQCPTFSLSEESLQAGKTLLTCTKCGKCLELCPRQAISFHIKGTPLFVHRYTAKLLFLYPVFLFSVAVGGGSIYNGLERISRLIFTGSMIH